MQKRSAWAHIGCGNLQVDAEVVNCEKLPQVECFGVDSNPDVQLLGGKEVSALESGERVL